MAKRSKTPIDEIADEAIRRIRAEAEKNMHAMQTEPTTPRGPKKGAGGRPRKGEGRREQKGVSLDPTVIAWVESQRAAAESFSETLERILRGNMHKN